MTNQKSSGKSVELEANPNDGSPVKNEKPP